MQRQHAGRRQIVEQGGGLIEEQGQVVLDAGRGDAGADIFVDARATRVAFDALAPAPAKRLPRCFVDRKFAARQQADFGHRIQPALRVRIEGTDRVELIAEQVEPIGQRRAHREQIDQSAADRKLAWRDHLRHVLIAGEHQLRTQRLRVDRLALLEEERMAGDVLRGRQPIQRARGRNDQDVDLGVRLA